MDVTNPLTLLRDPSSLILAAAVIVTLAYASWLDWKSRDIPELVWVPSFILVVGLNVVKGNYSNLIFLGIALVPALLVLVMSLLGLMGGADFLALLLIGLAFPQPLPLPLSFSALMYSLIIPLLFMAILIIGNITKYREVLARIKCDSGRKLYLYLFGKPVKLREYLKSRSFYYPLTVYRGGKVLCRASFGIDEDLSVIRKKLRDLIKERELDPEDYIVITPALPHIVFIFLGFIAGIILPPWFIFAPFI